MVLEREYRKFVFAAEFAAPRVFAPAVCKAVDTGIGQVDFQRIRCDFYCIECKNIGFAVDSGDARIFRHISKGTCSGVKNAPHGTGWSFFSAR